MIGDFVWLIWPRSVLGEGRHAGLRYSCKLTPRPLEFDWVIIACSYLILILLQAP